MKSKKLITRVFTFLMTVILVTVSSTFAVTSNAVSSANENTIGYVRKEAPKDEAEFVCFDLGTNEEYYYDLYLNGERIDLSEKSTINSPSRSLEISKFDEPYFPSTLNNESSTASPRTVFGNDGRTRVTDTTQHPYEAICYMTTTWLTGGPGYGTAWMYWDDIAITAAHCVYKSGVGKAVSVELIPGYNFDNNSNGGVGTGTLNGYVTVTDRVKMHIPNQWIQSEDKEYDYCVLELDTDIGSLTGYFGIYSTILTLWGTDITITGYPGEYNGEMWTMSGEVTTSRTRRIYYEIDTTSGQSGAPVYKSNNQVIAIHAYSGSTENSGTRITNDLYDYFHSFRD